MYGTSMLTVVTSKEEHIDKLETEDTQKVPADARHPPRVHVFGHDTGLEHALELDSDGEWQFHSLRSALANDKQVIRW